MSEASPNLCQCGCGQVVARRFAPGHNRRGATASTLTRTRQRIAQSRRATPLAPGTHRRNAYVLLLTEQQRGPITSSRTLEHAPLNWDVPWAHCAGAVAGETAQIVAAIARYGYVEARSVTETHCCPFPEAIVLDIAIGRYAQKHRESVAKAKANPQWLRRPPITSPVTYDADVPPQRLREHLQARRTVLLRELRSVEAQMVESGLFRLPESPS